MSRRHEALILAPKDLAAITSQAWAWCPLETGGLLLGHTRGSRAFCTHIIGPGPNATHNRYGFEPDHEWQAHEVARIWDTDPRVQYLGDWHTHPGGKPKPSPLDRSALRHIASDPGAQQPTPIMLIAALSQQGTCTPAAVKLHPDQRIRKLAIRVAIEVDTGQQPAP